MPTITLTAKEREELLDILSGRKVTLEDAIKNCRLRFDMQIRRLNEDLAKVDRLLDKILEVK